MAEPNKAVITLGEKDHAVLERAAGGTYHIRINQGKVAATIDRNTTLSIEGQGGKDALLFIPANAGLDPADFIPRIEVNTKKPLHVEGGPFILGKGGGQSAWVEATPAALADVTVGKDRRGAPSLVTDANPIRNAAQQDSRHAPGDASLKYAASAYNPRTVTVEKGARTIQFYAPPHADGTRDTRPLFVLSGRDEPEKNARDFDAFRRKILPRMEKALEREDLETLRHLGLATDAAPGQAAAPAPAIAPASRQPWRILTTDIGTRGRHLYDSHFQPWQRQGYDFKGLKEKAEKVLGGGPGDFAEKIRAFDDHLDGMIEKASQEKDGQAGKLREELEGFKQRSLELRGQGGKTGALGLGRETIGQARLAAPDSLRQAPGADLQAGTDVRPNIGVGLAPAPPQRRA